MMLSGQDLSLSEPQRCETKATVVCDACETTFVLQQRTGSKNRVLAGRDWSASCDKLHRAGSRRCTTGLSEHMSSVQHYVNAEVQFTS